MSYQKLFQTKPFSKTGIKKKTPLPEWFRISLPRHKELRNTQSILKENQLSTVCEEAKCPNRLECYSRNIATFLAMGKQCTRACGFCDIDSHSTPPPLQPDEPERIAKAVSELGLQHVVVTMVARDDLSDGGALHMKKIIHRIRTFNAKVDIEVLTSDFAGNTDSLDTIISAVPKVFNHNIETVEEKTPSVRHKATYRRSLQVLSYVSKQANKKIIVKSGLMVGLGETTTQVEKTIRDLQEAGCQLITIGQYLQPNRKKIRVKEYVPPQQFSAYADYGKSIGLKMFCGPMVRSSYHAKESLSIAE